MRRYTEEDILKRATPEEMKAKLVETLDALDAFCREHGLRYYLSGGTLLGAVRHQGFIPWDDDIDVNMPREDCEKLMELSGGRIGGCVLNPPNYEDETHAYHWKLYNEAILVRKGSAKIYPIFIDIFPIEGLPKTKLGNWFHYAHIIFWKSLADSLWGDKWIFGSTKAAKIFHAVVRPFASLWGKKRIFNHVVKVMKSIPFEKSDYVGVMATKVHTTEERVVKSEYTPVKEVSFEGRTFPGPAGFNTYLTQLYGGSYMELPPVEKRVSNHGLKPFHYRWAGQERPVQIAICGLIKSDNIGEQFIARGLEYLIQQGLKDKGIAKEVEFVEVDLLGRNDETYYIKGEFKGRLVNYYGYRLRGIFTEAVMKVFKVIAKHGKFRFVKNTCYRIRHFIYRHFFNYRHRLWKYFDLKMHNCAYIVVDGAGLLEYSYNEYQESLLLVSEYARANGLQVVYNAIGRAGKFDERDFRSTILKKALRAPEVKFVSARDSVETVQICAGSEKRVELLADAAFWMKETYGFENNPDRKKVGIGIIRGTALTGYNVKFKSEDWVDLFSGIALELEKRGYEYEFFTNGLRGDIVIGQQILMNLGLPVSKLVERPTKDVELYSTINQYAGIITCRMHSSIAAFTLGIPSVILSWNDKVNKLMEHIGYADRAVNLEHFDPVYIVDLFQKAMDEGVDPDKVQVMKDKAHRSVDGYIDLIAEAVENFKL